MGVWIDLLLDRFRRTGEFPPTREKQRWAEVARYVALRENDRDTLRIMSGWEPDDDRRYFIDPLAPKISESFASLVFGPAVTWEAAEPDDQERLDAVIDENRRAGLSYKNLATTMSSEGEVWWRIYVDLELADTPLVVWHSRLGVIPLWVGPKLRAVAFISRLDPIDDQDTMFWRHMEIHDDQHVQQSLWVSPNEHSIGDEVSILEHPDTAALREEPWAHGMERMLAGWIRNKDGSDPHKGYSDYDGIEDMLLELNESLEVGHSNMRLTARKRVVVPRSAVDKDTGRVPDDQEFFIADEDATTLGQEPGRGPWQVLEYSFDAEALSNYRRSIAIDALGRIGLNAQFTGITSDQAEAYATSGVALRLKLIPSINAGQDRAENVDRELPVIGELLQRLDAAPFQDAEQAGGFGRPWIAPEEQPSIDRGSALPEDETERDARLATNVEAQLLSRRTAIEEMHPDWSEERVIEELRLIAQDGGSTPEDAAIMWPLPGEEEAAAVARQQLADEQAAADAAALEAVNGGGAAENAPANSG